MRAISEGITVFLAKPSSAVLYALSVSSNILDTGRKRKGTSFLRLYLPFADKQSEARATLNPPPYPRAQVYATMTMVSAHFP